MSTKEANKTVAASMAGSDDPQPVCGPNEHWDPTVGACVPNSGGNEVSAYEETKASTEYSSKK